MAKIKLLPPTEDIETKAVLKQLGTAREKLGLLRGAASRIPNESILINTLILQEAKDSSEVESIFTTHDDMYKDQLEEGLIESAATKEVGKYAEALKIGFDKVKQNGVISNALILEIQSILKKNTQGYRKMAGTHLVNEATRAIVHTPPQKYNEIVDLMDNFVQFINDASLSNLDPLIKMALMHHQFETIHPFGDGNGRTGRILNILYLVKEHKVDLPILYLSRYIIRNKSKYYKYLQSVRETGNWEPWLIFILKGIEEISIETVTLIDQIKELMVRFKKTIREKYVKIYSQDLLNNIFKQPYTKIEFVMRDLQKTRVTATKYLDKLAEGGLLEKVKIGRNNYYINSALYELLKTGSNNIDANVDNIITINK